MSKPFEAGETVLLLDGKGRRYLVGLEAGGTFHSTPASYGTRKCWASPRE